MKSSLCVSWARYWKRRVLPQPESPCRRIGFFDCMCRQKWLRFLSAVAVTMNGEYVAVTDVDLDLHGMM